MSKICAGVSGAGVGVWLGVGVWVGVGVSVGVWVGVAVGVGVGVGSSSCLQAKARTKMTRAKTTARNIE